MTVARRKSASRPIICALSSDDGYVIGLTVTVRSMLEHLAPGRSVELHIADGGISAENRERFLESIAGFPVTCRFMDPDMRRVSKLKACGYLKVPTYFRLLLPRMMPRDCSKVLYLDSDLLIRSDVGALFDLPLPEPLGAVQSLFCPYVVSVPGLPNFRELGLKADTAFFNAGVLLMNLDVWRREKLGPKVMDYVEKHAEHITMSDNQGLVGTLANRWKQLDRRWNVEHHAPPPDARIVHFVYAIKPWHHGFRHPSRDEWFEVLDRTAFRGWRPRPEKATGTRG